MILRFALVLVCAFVFARADAQQIRPKDGIIPERYQLENGMKVVLCSLDEKGPIAVQFYYDFGVLDDPAGLPQANRLLAKMRERAAIGDYEIDEAKQLLNAISSTSSDGLPGGVRVSFTAYEEDMDLVFSIEADRMRGVQIDADLLTDARAWMNDVLNILEDQYNPPLMTPAISAAAQYWRDGAKSVSLRGEYAENAEQLNDLMHTAFAPERATLIVFGAFDKVAIKDMIAQHFNDIERVDGSLTRVTPTHEAAEVNWDLNETVVVVAYDTPDDNVAAATMTVWGQVLAGKLTNDDELVPLVKGITSNQLAYPVGPMPVFIYARVLDGVDPAVAAETLARRAEAVALEQSTPIEFKQLGNTARMFVGRLIINSQSIDRRAQLIGRQQDLKMRPALLAAVQQMSNDVGLIEIAFAPQIREVAGLIVNFNEDQLIEILSQTINADNRSVVVLQPDD